MKLFFSVRIQLERDVLHKLFIDKQIYLNLNRRLLLRSFKPVKKTTWHKIIAEIC